MLKDPMSDSFRESSVSADLAAALCALVLPAGVRTVRAASMSDALRQIREPGTTACAIYLDTRLPGALLKRVAALWALIRIWRASNACGFNGRRIHRLREAHGEMYEAVPIAGAAPLAGVGRAWAALLLRGGRVALSVWREGVPVADRMIADAPAEWDGEAGATIFLGSGSVFRLAARGEMLRVPVGSQAVARLTRGFEALLRAQALSLNFAVPRAMRRFEVAGFNVFVESRVPFAGFDYLNMESKARDAVRAQALAAIAHMHEASRRVSRCAEKDIERLFARPVRRLTESPSMTLVHAQLDAFLAAVRKTFVGQEITTVLSHGDCKIANFLHDGAFNVRGLVDWDRAHIEGLPGVDLVHYCAFDDMLAGQGTIANTLLARAQAMDNDPFFDHYRARFLVEGFRWRAVAVMALVQHVAEQLDAGNEQAHAEMALNPPAVAAALEWAMGATSPAA
jgi:aminoglycoside phosphotransferase (APT) family kinase protein